MKEFNKQLAVFIIIILVVTAASLAHFSGLLNRFEYMAYDAVAQYLRAETTLPDDVKVVLIDEASLQSLNPVVGRWPWPRAIYADLLDFFSLAPPRMVLFDILFTETQDPSGEQPGPNDRALVQATAAAGFVYHAMQVLKDNPDTHNTGLLDRPLPEDFVKRFSLALKGAGRFDAKGKNNNYYIPFPSLYRASHGVAVVEYSPDDDGVFRRTAPVREYDGQYFPVFGLAPFMEGETITMGENGIQVGERLIPTGPGGETLVNMYGSFAPYSISGIFASLQQVMAGELENLVVDPEEFRDKVVYVGSSAVGVEDLKPTPLSPRTPGVFLHASLAGNFFQDEFLRQKGGVFTFSLIVFFTLVAVPSVVFFQSYLLKYGIPAGLAVGLAATYLYGFAHGVVYQAVPPLFALLLSTGGSVGYLLFTEGREKRKVKGMFSQYVSEDVLNAVMADYEKYGSMFTGVEKDISIMFSDIRSFTSYSDSTTAETVVRMLNIYFSYMTDVILEGRGTIDKYIGDAIMAFWGAPVELKDHADHCVQAAIGMTLELERSNRHLKEAGIDYAVRAGIGINSGPAIVGNIGSEKKLSYTVIGDTVNLASRLEHITKDWGVKIIISEFTYQKLTGDYPIRVIDRVPVRGKRVPVKIYEVIPFRDEAEKAAAEEQCRIANAAYERYEKEEWREALELYRSLEPCVLRDTFVEKLEEKTAQNGQGV